MDVYANVIFSHNLITSLWKNGHCSVILILYTSTHPKLEKQKKSFFFPFHFSRFSGLLFLRGLIYNNNSIISETFHNLLFPQLVVGCFVTRDKCDVIQLFLLVVGSFHLMMSSLFCHFISWLFNQLGCKRMQH